MITAHEDRSQPKQLDQSIRDRIMQMTGGRIHALEVEVVGERVVIRGFTASYYLKQLVLEGVLDVVGGPGAMNVEFNVQVLPNPAKFGQGNE
ncbi:MAG TPA: hypothetical protein VGZ47_01075 [Gemmataceae bacterium]|jgi:hypothetical protein|nr:hypothetical protein [Gemmataceae bacterium]